MKFEKSVPHSNILTARLLDTIRNSDELKYHMTDVFITELEHGKHWKPVVSEIGEKRKVSVTISGIVENHCIFNDRYVNSSMMYYSCPEYYDYCIDDDTYESRDIDLMGETINFTFIGVRIKRNPTAQLYIDSTHSFYDFIKPILVNDGIMDIRNCNNIILSFDELQSILKDRVETVKTKHKNSLNKQWYIKCKKGDNDGE